MELSSDEDEVPLDSSLRFSGTSSSACFLVQNSQPSPEKRDARVHEHFLQDLTQLNRRLDPSVAQPSSDSDSKSVKTICSSGPSLPKPIVEGRCCLEAVQSDAEGKENEMEQGDDVHDDDKDDSEMEKKIHESAKTTSRSIEDSGEICENNAASSTRDLNQSGDSNADNVIPSSLANDSEDSTLKIPVNEPVYDRDAFVSNDSLVDIFGDAICPNLGVGDPPREDLRNVSPPSPNVDSSPGAHLVSDALTAVAATTTSGADSSVSETTGENPAPGAEDKRRHGQRFVSKNRLEELKRRSSKESSIGREIASAEKESDQRPEFIKVDVDTPDRLAASITMSPSYEKDDERDDLDIDMPRPGPPSQEPDSQEEKDEVKRNRFVDESYHRRTHQLSPSQPETTQPSIVQECSVHPIQPPLRNAKESADLFDSPSVNPDVASTINYLAASQGARQYERGKGEEHRKDECKRSASAPAAVGASASTAKNLKPNKDEANPDEGSVTGSQTETVPETILADDELATLESGETMRINKSVVRLKRRRKEVDYKILSQRGKDRESNAFASPTKIVERRRREKAPNTTKAAMRMQDEQLKAKLPERSRRRSSIIVRMAKKRVSAARRMEMIRRRSSMLREGSAVVAPLTESDTSDAAAATSRCNAQATHSRNNSANTSLPTLGNSSLGRYRLASSTPLIDVADDCVASGRRRDDGNRNDASHVETLRRQAKRQRSGDEDDREKNKKGRTDEPPDVPLDDVIIHRKTTKRIFVEVTEEWIRPRDMKVLKRTFAEWEEDPVDEIGQDNRGLGSREGRDDWNVQIGSPISGATDSGKDKRAGYTADSSSLDSSKTSKDSLFRPGKPTGPLFARELPLAPSTLKPVRRDGETTTSTSETGEPLSASKRVPSRRRNAPLAHPNTPSLVERPMDPPSKPPSRSTSGGSLAATFSPQRSVAPLSLSAALRGAGVEVCEVDENVAESNKNEADRFSATAVSTSGSGDSTNTIPASDCIPETEMETDGRGSERHVRAKPKTPSQRSIGLKACARTRLERDRRSCSRDTVVVEYEEEEEEMFMMEDEEAVVTEPEVGSLILAKWSGDGFFYPGKIYEIIEPPVDPSELSNARFTVLFDDGDTRVVRGSDVIFRRLLPIGCHVMATVDASAMQDPDVFVEPVFEPAVVLGHVRKRARERPNSVSLGYVVERKSNGASASVPRASVILTSHQALPLLAPGAVSSFDPPPLEGVSGISLDNVLSGKRRRPTTTPSTPTAEKPASSSGNASSPMSSRKRNFSKETPSTPKGARLGVGSAGTPKRESTLKLKGDAALISSVTRTPRREQHSLSRQISSPRAKGFNSTPSRRANSTPTTTKKTPAKSSGPLDKKITPSRGKRSDSEESKRSEAEVSKEIIDSAKTVTVPQATPRSAGSEDHVGPLPVGPIFASLTFLLTHGEKIRAPRPKDASTDSETDDEGLERRQIKFVKGHLSAQIRAGGGAIFCQSETMSLGLLKKLKTFCVANTFCRTAKYINALAFSIPCVSHVWIVDSSSANSLLDFRKYLLPRGLNIESESLVEQPSGAGGIANLPGIFKEKKFVLSSEEPSFPSTWTPVLRGAGASRVVPVAPGSLLKPEILLSVDAVVADETCGAAIVSGAVNAGVPVVSTEWVIQSLIVGRCVNPKGHPRYAWDYKDE